MKIRRTIIHIDEEKCDGCGLCIIACAEGALKIIDGKARIVSDKYCDGLGDCLGECPRGALTLIEREADEFDEEAVHVRSAATEFNDSPKGTASPCGCPSSQVQLFPMAPSPAPDQDTGPTDSMLTHWPVKIRLIPENAPFLKGADVVIAADCATVAYARLHNDFIKNHVIMCGCPKFDDLPSYTEKFSRIFSSSGLRSITVVSMEVPCCSGLSTAVRTAIDASGRDIPLKEVIISLQGLRTNQD